MTDATMPASTDLNGTADERIRQLSEADPTALQSAEWLLRQLNGALSAWAADETRLDIDIESRVDY
ncbi:hypothetical protein [Microbacterium pumilum]|uniref:Uncharacterized protein n=1 Tax=Microbacterium pumilum TaxID=344165 RepID=A0ABP5EAQ6_9MICO